MIKGKACVIVVDVQRGLLDPSCQFYDPEYVKYVERCRVLLDKAREVGIPIVYLQEVHRENRLDIGRELEGDENMHCVETSPYTEVAEKELGRIPETEPLVKKRRYSGFLYTELEVVLSGLGVHPGDTLILFGGFTDVCVHYTFVDAHQRDYRLRVVTDLCTASNEERGKAALEAMRYLQHEAPRTREEMIDELEAYKLAHAGAEES
jgi:nicotinamidase-related amidase